MTQLSIEDKLKLVAAHFGIPIVVEAGIERFKSNFIIRGIAHHQIDHNSLWLSVKTVELNILTFEDWLQFQMLGGWSVSGLGDVVSEIEEKLDALLESVYKITMKKV